MAADIGERKAESTRQGVTLRLEELARLFHLTPFDVDTLLICLALELDLRYERLYAYLQDDVTKKLPSVDLVLNLLGGKRGHILNIKYSQILSFLRVKSM
jgi:hypothetical protein